MANRSPVMQEYKNLDAAFSAAVGGSKSKLRSSLTQWSCRHFRTYSEVEAYNIASGTRQIVAEVIASKDINVESVAEGIATAANNYDSSRKLIRHMADALEKCLACKGISWEAEHDGDIMIRRAREYLKE
jgi:hypothetical protein